MTALGGRQWKIVPQACGRNQILVVSVIKLLDVAASKRHTVQLKTCPLPFLSPCFIPPSHNPLFPFSLSFVCLLPLFSPIHCQEGPHPKGQFSAAWQRQRLAARTATTVSGFQLQGVVRRLGTCMAWAWNDSRDCSWDRSDTGHLSVAGTTSPVCDRNTHAAFLHIR